MEKPHTGLDDCLNMVLSCFRKKMSETGLISIEFETISADENLFPSVSICLYPNIGQLWEYYKMDLYVYRISDILGG